MLIFGWGAGRAAGWLRRDRGWRVACTRKVFHFLVFSAATAVHLLRDRPAVVLFGSAIAALVLAAVVRGERSSLYAALARPSDAPRERLFILLPLVTTAAGGVLANVLFPATAPVGYLVAGWGDAVGEPVGARLGRHPYRVPSFAGLFL